MKVFQSRISPDALCQLRSELLHLSVLFRDRRDARLAGRAQLEEKGCVFRTKHGELVLSFFQQRLSVLQLKFCGDKCVLHI